MKSKRSPSILTNGNVRRCYLTGTTAGLDIHHILPGRRALCDKWGLWVYLNHEIHMKIHNDHWYTPWRYGLIQEGQKRFEKLYGHDKWMEVFHKNYITEESK